MKISVYNKTLSLKELCPLELAALNSLVIEELTRRTEEIKSQTETADTTECKWFTFNQNNSGGSFDINEDVAPYVIIQAGNAGHANWLAEKIGIYFDGKGDCDCCGRRWSETYDDGNENPEIYGQAVPYLKTEKSFCLYDNDKVIVYPFGSIK